MQLLFVLDMTHITGGSTAKQIDDWFSLKPIENHKAVPRSAAKPEKPKEQVPMRTTFKPRYMRKPPTSDQSNQYPSLLPSSPPAANHPFTYPPINRPPPLQGHYQGSTSPPSYINSNQFDSFSTISHPSQNSYAPTDRPHSPGAHSDTTYLTGLTGHTLTSEISALDKLYGYGDFHGETPVQNRNIVDNTRVFERYGFDKPNVRELPIFKHKDQILETIEKHVVSIIQGSTGSGKTTQVPQYILEYHAKRGLHCNIICTQPRRIAAMSIAKRVCHERGWQLGSLVGYQVALDKVSSEDTRVMFVTTGILLRKLISQKDMTEYTHVILDEVHERDLDTDFVMLISKYLLQTNSARTKLVLMSATFDASLFSNYFNVYQEGLLTPAPIISVGGKSFPVMEFYLNELKLKSLPQHNIDDPRMFEECIHVTAYLINSFDSLETKDKQGTLQKGTVLVFLPGLNEISTVYAYVENACSNIAPMRLHSSIGVEEQQMIFRKPEKGKRKVILSTNIAESSITVPDIRYVIDFCLVKELMCDPSTNYQCLRIAWASKASMLQRRGRAGRVAEGRVYRLIQREFYRECREYTLPEIKRCPLERIVLQSKVLDIGAPVEVLSMAMEQPEAMDIESTVLLLKEMGALSATNMDPFDGELTFLGHVCEALPVDIRMGKLLLLGHVFGCLEECIVVAAALSVRSFFTRPFHVELKAYRSKMRWANNSFSDPIAMLNAYRDWYREKKSGRWDNKSDRVEKNWCQKNFLQHNRMNDVHEMVKELSDRLFKFNITAGSILSTRTNISSSHNLLLIKLVIAGAFYPNYFRWSQIDEQEVERTMCSHDPHTTVMVAGLPLSRHNDQYTEDVVKCFEQCGYIKQIHFESSRAYIEFQRLRLYSDEWDSTLSTSGSSLIVPAVYVALKMRQLKNGRLTIIVDNPVDEVDETRSQLPSRCSSRSSIQSSLDPPPCELKKSGEISLFVTEIVNAGHFWALEFCEENKQISQDMSNSIRDIPHMVPLQIPAVYQYCLALFPSDGLFYRGRLVDVNMGKRSVTVHYLDFGSMEQLRFDQVYQIPSDILEYPILCVECFLAKVKPSFKESPDGTWTLKSRAFFSNLALNQVLNAEIYSQVEGSLRVYLYTKDSDKPINQLLIDTGYALDAEESYQSVSAHEKAKEPEFTYDKPLESFQLSINHLPPQKKLYLKGPSSPYEVSFYSLTKIGKMKSARIDWDSVNSICLNHEPQDKHERLMVSAFLNLNSTATSLIARESTLLPNINGLLYVITLLFSPYVEFRTDELRRTYTGALCGLGFDNTVMPYFPEHDISLTFDTLITQEDINEINAIRDMMNIALRCNQDFKIPWNASYVVRNQGTAKRRLLDLVTKEPRPSVPLIEFTKSYTWNMVDPQNIIEHNPPADHGVSLPPVYSLHNSIKLSVHDPDTCRIPASVLLMRTKMKRLHELASCSEMPVENLFCELCNARCQTPLELSAHIASRQHMLMDNSLYQ